MFIKLKISNVSLSKFTKNFCDYLDREFQHYTITSFDNGKIVFERNSFVSMGPSNIYRFAANLIKRFEIHIYVKDIRIYYNINQFIFILVLSAIFFLGFQKIYNSSQIWTFVLLVFVCVSLVCSLIIKMWKIKEIIKNHL